MITEPSTCATFLLPPHDPPRGGDEPGMRHHAVGGAHAEAVDVPGTQKRLDGLAAGEAPQRAAAPQAAARRTAQSAHTRQRPPPPSPPPLLFFFPPPPRFHLLHWTE